MQLEEAVHLERSWSVHLLYLTDVAPREEERLLPGKPGMLH